MTQIAEITLDPKGLTRGFTGAISRTELFASFPEAGIWFVLVAYGAGDHPLSVTLLTGLLWLVARQYLEWASEKGFKVNWDRVGFSNKGPGTGLCGVNPGRFLSYE